MDGRTTKQIAETCGVDERTVRRRTNKTADTMSGVADKMPASTSQHPASFTLQDTVEIVRAGARTKDWE